MGSNRRGRGWPGKAFANGDHTGVCEAVDLEEASRGINKINARVKRERGEQRTAEIANAKKAAITLPSLETLNKLMGR